MQVRPLTTVRRNKHRCSERGPAAATHTPCSASCRCRASSASTVTGAPGCPCPTDPGARSPGPPGVPGAPRTLLAEGDPEGTSTPEVSMPASADSMACSRADSRARASRSRPSCTGLAASCRYAVAPAGAPPGVASRLLGVAGTMGVWGARGGWWAPLEVDGGPSAGAGWGGAGSAWGDWGSSPKASGPTASPPPEDDGSARPAAAAWSPGVATGGAGPLGAASPCPSTSGSPLSSTAPGKGDVSRMLSPGPSSPALAPSPVCAVCGEAVSAGTTGVLSRACGG